MLSNFKTLLLTNLVQCSADIFQNIASSSFFHTTYSLPFSTFPLSIYNSYHFFYSCFFFLIPTYFQVCECITNLIFYTDSLLFLLSQSKQTNKNNWEKVSKQPTKLHKKVRTRKKDKERTIM